MRTVLVLLAAIVMTLINGPIVIVARLVGVKEKPGGIYAWATRSWCRVVNRVAGVRVRLHNPERIAERSGGVYIANHVSWFDVFALAAVLPRYSFIAKSELRRIPLFGFAAEAAGIVFLERDNRKAAFESYKGAAEQVAGGRPIVVFPEGTRGRDYRLRPFKKGPFVLAISAQAPVVPTIVHGAREVQPKGTLRVRPGVVDIHFLEPIETRGLDYDDRAGLMATVWERMASTMRDVYGVGTNEYPIARAGERSA